MLVVDFHSRPTADEIVLAFESHFHENNITMETLGLDIQNFHFISDKNSISKIMMMDDFPVMDDDYELEKEQEEENENKLKPIELTP